MERNVVRKQRLESVRNGETYYYNYDKVDEPNFAETLCCSYKTRRIVISDLEKNKYVARKV